MSISGGGGPTFQFNPTPDIYQQQVSGQKEMQKHADIGQGNVVIVPQAEQDLIPFTKMA